MLSRFNGKRGFILLLGDGFLDGRWLISPARRLMFGLEDLHTVSCSFPSWTRVGYIYINPLVSTLSAEAEEISGSLSICCHLWTAFSVSSRTTRIWSSSGFTGSSSYRRFIRVTISSLISCHFERATVSVTPWKIPCIFESERRGGLLCELSQIASSVPKTASKFVAVAG